MACFLVPAAEAAVVTAANLTRKKHEESHDTKMSFHVPFSKKVKWLTNMLWGGSALLAFEHIWHGEVTPWFPFLTAAANPADTAEMLHEMSTVGVSMAALVTVVWAGMVLVSGAVEKRAQSAAPAAE